jgi:siroheme synthase (precorrin-2 oxidase/ferrochelatase)
MDENPQRRTYWQIDDWLNCPVVGTCLSLAEQKKILKKSGYKIAHMSDYQIHHMLVHSGQTGNVLAQRIQRRLEAKYRREIDELGNCDEETFLRCWETGLRNGEIDALLWIGSTNPNMSPEALNRMFGDYHMHMHGQGAVIRRQLRQLDTSKAKNQKLTSVMKEVRAEKQQIAQRLHTAERDRENLKQEMERQERVIEALQDRPQQEDLERANIALQDKVQLLESRLQAQSAALAQLRVENIELAAAAAEQERINQLLQAEFDWLTQAYVSEPDSTPCAQCENCPCRVLFVGGLDRLRPHYQQLVENCGGEFKYHDGRGGSGERSLRPVIGWADVILCPVDINSHNACLTVKKLCRKMQKPYRMLDSSSLSNVSRVLSDFSTEFDTLVGNRSL